MSDLMRLHLRCVQVRRNSNRPVTGAAVRLSLLTLCVLPLTLPPSASIVRPLRSALRSSALILTAAQSLPTAHAAAVAAASAAARSPESPSPLLSPHLPLRYSPMEEATGVSRAIALMGYTPPYSSACACPCATGCYGDSKPAYAIPSSRPASLDGLYSEDEWSSLIQRFNQIGVDCMALLGPGSAILLIVSGECNS